MTPSMRYRYVTRNFLDLKMLIGEADLLQASHGPYPLESLLGFFIFQVSSLAVSASTSIECGVHFRASVGLHLLSP